jgi:ParB family transcriptional regulator, chromosome partitioning protein
MTRNNLVDVDFIHPHPDNIRADLGDLTELADSIRQHGLLQPLVVQPHPTRQGHYQVLAGHRRLAAGKLAGKFELPALVRHGVDGTRALEMMLVENCQRVDLGPMEQAEAMEKLRFRGYTGADIARTTGLSQSTVSYHLSLLELDASSRDLVRTGKLAVGEAISAVRETRKAERARTGQTVTRTKGSYKWEPEHLTDGHPLARKAAKLCDQSDHTMRRRVGQTACGQCWETAIRTDERATVAAQDECEQPQSRTTQAA